MTATVAPALSSTDTHLFEDPTPVAPIPTTPIPDILARFDLPATISQLREGNYRRIALQFPDELLYASIAVADAITSALNESAESGPPKRVFILADTSFGSCCVDEVAAEHAEADCLVHFGRACLSPTSRLPVIYVFGKDQLPEEASVDDVVRDFMDKFPEKDLKVILLAPPSLQWHLPSIKSALEGQGYTNLFLSEASNDPQSAVPNHTLPPDSSSYSIYHLSHPSPPLLLTLTSHFSSTETFPSTPLSASRILSRRYALTRSVLSARIIGILVNTLSVTRYLPTLTRVRKLITDAGKTPYVFVVGKVNTPKLANFEEVDVWVAVGCWEQDIVGVEGRGHEFWKPVVNVLELEVGLGLRTWGGWKGGFEFDEEERQEDEDERSEDEVDYDLLTKKLVVKTKKLRLGSKPSAEESTSDALTRMNQENALAATGGVVSASAQYMQTNRSWRGLGSDWVDVGYEREEGKLPEGAEMEVGRGGVARGYAGEGKGANEE